MSDVVLLYFGFSFAMVLIVYMLYFIFKQDKLIKEIRGLEK